MRSTTAPETSAVVTMQNVAWNAMNRSSGICVPACALNPTPERKR